MRLMTDLSLGNPVLVPKGSGGSGGSFSPLLVDFNGTDTGVNVAPTITKPAAYTIAFRMRATELATGQYFCEKEPRFGARADNRIFFRMRGDDGGSVTNLLTGSFTPTGGSVNLNDDLSVIISFDASQGLTGGNSAVLWVNGNVEISTTAVFDGIARLQMFLGGDGGSNFTAGQAHQWVWVKSGDFIDPATQWNLFFNPDFSVKDLGATGEVGGITPTHYINGNAAVWNTSAYSGAVTDVGGSPSSSVSAVAQGDGSYIFETDAEGDHTIELLSGMRGAGTEVTITDADMTSQLNTVSGPGWSGDETTVGATLTALPAIYTASTDLTAADPLFTIKWQEGGFDVSTVDTYDVATEATYRGLEIVQSTVNPDPLSTTEFLTATTTVIAGQTPRLSFDGATHSLDMMSTPEDVYDYCYAFSVTPSTTRQVIGNGNPNVDFRDGDELRVLATFSDNSTSIFSAADDVSSIALNTRHSFIVSMSTSSAVTDGGSNFVVWHHSLGKIMEKTMTELGNPAQSLRFNARLGGPNADAQKAAFHLEGGGFWGMVGKSINVDQEAANIFNGDGTWNAALTAAGGRFESTATPGVFFDPNNDTALTDGVSVHGWVPSYQALVDAGVISIAEGMPTDAPT